MDGISVYSFSINRMRKIDDFSCQFYLHFTWIHWIHIFMVDFILCIFSKRWSLVKEWYVAHMWTYRLSVNRVFCLFFFSEPFWTLSCNKNKNTTKSGGKKYIASNFRCWKWVEKNYIRNSNVAHQRWAVNFIMCLLRISSKSKTCARNERNQIYLFAMQIIMSQRAENTRTTAHIHCTCNIIQQHFNGTLSVKQF